jgi:hypothetical protein
MKLFLMAVLMMSAASANFTTYRGETYKADLLNKCESDFKKMSQRIESVEGFKVIDGGCISLFEGKQFKLEFNYLHPLTKRLEVEKIVVSTNKVCEKLNAQIENKITSAGNVYIHSYCNKNELNINQIDLTYSIMRDLTDLGTYNTYNACDQFLQNFEMKANSKKVFVIAADCKKIIIRNGNTSFYRPIVKINSHHKIEIEMIKGTKINTLSGCDLASETTQNRFSKANVSLVMSYCDNNEDHFQEHILFIKPDLPYFVTDYRSLKTTSMQECKDSLARIEMAIESINQDVLYSYCKKISDKHFNPIVKYVKEI